MPQSFASQQPAPTSPAPAPSHGNGGPMGENGGHAMPATGPLGQPGAWPSFADVSRAQASFSPPAPAIAPPAPTPQQQQSPPPTYQTPAFGQPGAPYQPAPQYQQPQQYAPAQQYPTQAQLLQPPQQQAAPFNDGLQLAGPLGGNSSGGSGGAAPPTVAHPQPQQQPASAPSTVIRDRLAQQGASVAHYQDDEQLLDDLGTSVQEIQTLQHYARIGREASAGARVNGSPAVSPPNGAAAPSQASPSQPAPGAPANAPPPVPDGWEQYVRRDPATGRFVPADNFANPQIAEQANQRAAWERVQAQKLLADPIGTLRERGLDDILKEVREQTIKEIREQEQRERTAAESKQAVTQFIEANAPALFQIGADGRELVNQVTGQPLLTPRGQAFAQYMQEHGSHFRERYGSEPDQRDSLEYARTRLQLDDQSGRFGAPVQQPQQMPPQQPYYMPAVPGYNVPAQPPFYPQQATPPWPVAPQPAQPQQPFVQQPGNSVSRALGMNGFAYQPNQGGTIVSAAQNPGLPQNSARMPFVEQLKAMARQQGVMHPNEA